MKEKENKNVVNIVLVGPSVGKKAFINAAITSQEVKHNPDVKTENNPDVNEKYIPGVQRLPKNWEKNEDFSKGFMVLALMIDSETSRKTFHSYMNNLPMVGQDIHVGERKIRVDLVYIIVNNRPYVPAFASAHTLYGYPNFISCDAGDPRSAKYACQQTKRHLQASMLEIKMGIGEVVKTEKNTVSVSIKKGPIQDFDVDEYSSLMGRPKPPACSIL